MKMIRPPSKAVCGDPLELGRQDESNGEQLYQLSMKPDGRLSPVDRS